MTFWKGTTFPFHRLSRRFFAVNDRAASALKNSFYQDSLVSFFWSNPASLLPLPRFSSEICKIPNRCNFVSFYRCIRSHHSLGLCKYLFRHWLETKVLMLAPQLKFFCVCDSLKVFDHFKEHSCLRPSQAQLTLIFFSVGSASDIIPRARQLCSSGF